jgi:hypothetical protein
MMGRVAVCGEDHRLDVVAVRREVISTGID